jgi:hypothetical protein
MNNYNENKIKKKGNFILTGAERVPLKQKKPANAQFAGKRMI